MLHIQRSFAALLAILVVFVSALAQAGAIDPSFNPSDIGNGNGDGANDAVYTTAVQADGKIIIGGQFTSYNGIGRNRIARLNADGSLDAGFDPGTGAGSSVLSTVVQTDGKIIIGGTFTSYNGTGRNRIARLNADGSLDTSFDPGTGASSTVLTTVVQADGKIIIGGYFASYNGTGRSRIARLNADGSLDTGFNPGMGANGAVEAVAVRSDGKIIIGGQFTSYNGTGRNRIARLNADGSLDTGFDPGTGASSPVLTTVVQADGKIIIGGTFTSYNGTGRNRIARLNVDGTLDTDFDPGTGAGNDVQSIALQADGKIFIGGTFFSYNGTARGRVARLNSDGSLDIGYDSATGVDNMVLSSALQADGKIIIGGLFTSYNGAGQRSVARLNADGSLDTGFNPGTGANGTVETITAQADGKVIIGGTFSRYNGTRRNCIARLNADGSLDTGFDPGTGTNGTILSSTMQADGKIIIGGTFTTYNGIGRNRIARLNADGSLDSSFDPGTGASGDVMTISVQVDGKVIIGGWFTGYNGTVSGRLARLNTDGSVDAGFNPGTGADGMVGSIAVQGDGKIIIGGQFTSYNGIASERIARLNADGSFDTGFDPGDGVGGTVLSTAVLADGKIIISGHFTSYNGIGRNRIARLNVDGSLDTSFDPGTGAGSSILSSVLQPDGRIIIGGGFLSYNGMGRNRIARLNADGSLDASFDPGTGASNSVECIAMQTDGRIIIGGSFTNYNGSGRNRVARVLTCAAGTACDDGNACTTNDVLGSDCQCTGTFADGDGDGTCDANDGCPNDPLKTAAGICGCGAADTDSDNDGTANCNDGCPNDLLKIASGICGCGVADTDTDGDGTADCADNCPNVPGQAGSPCDDGDPCTTNDALTGSCTCAGTLADADGDGVCDANDCAPSNASAYPGAVEICDGIDNDCDGLTDQVQMNGMKLHLPFDGNADDASGLGHHGTVHNASLTPGRNGQAGSAYAFNGIDSRIEVADHIDLHPASFTIATWFYYDAVPGDVRCLLNKPLCGGYSDSYGIWFQGGQLMAGWGYGANSLDYHAFAAPSVGAWHHIALTVNASTSTAAVFIDNVLMGSYPVTQSIAYDNTPLVVGCDYENCALAFFFNGRMEDVVLLDRALGAAEVTDLYTDGVMQDLFNSYYPDADGDGFGVNSGVFTACTQPPNAALVGGDCADDDATVYPGASELCDGIDNDCDGDIDERTALDFDGADDHVLVGSWFPEQVFTIEMWLKPATTQNMFANIVDNNHAFNVRWVCQQNGSTTNQYYWAVAAGPSAQVYFSLQPDTWQHLALVKSPEQVAVYVNGTLVGTAPASGPINGVGSGDFIRLGKWAGGGREWNGSMDDVRFWNTARTEAEIQATMFQAVPPQAGLVANYPMNDGVPNTNNTAVTTLADASGNGHTATPLGFAMTGNASNFVGGLADQDADGLSDCIDNCPTTPGQVGSACNDNNTCTTNDVVDGDCQCTGVLLDADGDGSCDLEDCAPNDPAIHPGAQELCDGVDNNCNGVVDELAQVITLRSGNGTFGQPDAAVRMLVGPSDAPFPAAFTAADFLAARNGIAPIIIENNPAWLAALPSDPLAKWVNDVGNSGAGSTGLYAVDFNLSGPVADAQLTFRYAVDNVLGGGSDQGVFLNGQPLSGNTTGGDYTSEYVFTRADIGPLLQTGLNTLYVNAADLGSPGAVIFSATITTSGCTMHTWYLDADGDGYGNATVSLDSDSQPNGYVIDSTDCNDSTPSIHPGAPELCDGLDNDCDGVIDLLSALDFDGVNDHIALPPALYNGPWSALTVEAWIRSNGTTGDFQAILGTTDFSFVHLHTHVGANSAVYTDQGPVLLPVVPVLPSGEWHHVALSVASGNSVLYVDGVALGSSPTAFNAIVAPSTLTVGQGFQGGRNFFGQIRDLRIWNVARTAVEVQVDMNSVPQPTPALVLRMPLNDGTPGANNASITTVSDLSGNAHNGTLVNFALNGSASNWTGTPLAMEVCDGIDNDCDGIVDEGCDVRIAVKVMLDGPYDANTGLMQDGMRALGLVPTTEPYSGLGYAFVEGGGESTAPGVLANTGADAVVDWVVLELRDSDDPTVILASRSALLQRDGDAVDVDGTSPVTMPIGAGTYHVAVRHRNHLGCMTANAVALAPAPSTLDFTAPATATFGTNARKSVAGLVPAQVLWAGDVTFSGSVQYTGAGNDRDPILVTVGSTTPNNVVSNTYSTRDVNLNGNVQYTGAGNDRDPILVNVGSTTPNNVRTEQLP